MATSFLAYSFKHALVFNISMATVRLGLILLSTWLKSPPDELDENMIRIVESNLHLAATLTLVAVLGYIKEQWVSVESEAVSLRTMAHIDGLTGVSNRRRTAEFLAACLDPRYMACAVVMFDLDGFKRINDQFGHEAGDQVLRRFGTLARGYVATDRVGGWGGEEFLMVLPNTTLAEASRMAEGFRRLLEARNTFNGVTITASFGVAEWQPSETLEQFVGRADQAMYPAKAYGKNVVFKSPDGSAEPHLSA